MLYNPAKHETAELNCTKKLPLIFLAYNIHTCPIPPLHDCMPHAKVFSNKHSEYSLVSHKVKYFMEC